MTTLVDFETLEEAQAYSYVTYKDMSTSELNAYLGAYGLISYVKNLTDEKGLALQATLAANGNFCFDESDAIGLSNLNYIDELIAKEDEYTDYLSALKEDLVEYCKSDEVFPYVGKTSYDLYKAKDMPQEEVGIDCTTETQTLTLSFTTQPEQIVDVKVYHRLSSDKVTWSDWIQCQTFNNILYPQEVHKKTVAATTAPYREMKAICYAEIGMTIA